MDRFSVTALPATALPGTAPLAPRPQGSQPGPSSTWHQSQEQLAMQLPHSSDDSAHDPGNLGGRLGSGSGDEEAEAPAARSDLAALRGRDDSARDMPVLLHVFTVLFALFALQWKSCLRQNPKMYSLTCGACDLCAWPTCPDLTTAPLMQAQAQVNTQHDKGRTRNSSLVTLVYLQLLSRHQTLPSPVHLSPTCCIIFGYHTIQILSRFCSNMSKPCGCKPSEVCDAGCQYCQGWLAWRLRTL